MNDDEWVPWVSKGCHYSISQLDNVDEKDARLAMLEALNKVEKNWVWHFMPKHPSHVYQRGYEQALRDVREMLEEL